MDSLRETALLPGGRVEMVGIAFHGLTPHGNRYCRAFGAFRWDAPGQVGLLGCGGIGVVQRFADGGWTYLWIRLIVAAALAESCGLMDWRRTLHGVIGL